MILVLVIATIAGSGGFGLAFLLTPTLFMLYRVFTRDNLARWVTTGLALVTLHSHFSQRYWAVGSFAILRRL